MHTLDWKHAWTGRLLTTAPTRPQALKLLEPQLDSCNARLIGEVASGKLPFLNLPFRSSLTARLKALTPQLRVDNVTDAYYESTQYYPMPLRNYLVSLLFEF